MLKFDERSFSTTVFGFTKVIVGVENIYIVDLSTKMELIKLNQNAIILVRVKYMDL